MRARRGGSARAANSTRRQRWDNEWEHRGGQRQARRECRGGRRLERRGRRGDERQAKVRSPGGASAREETAPGQRAGRQPFPLAPQGLGGIEGSALGCGTEALPKMEQHGARNPNPSSY